MAFRVSSPLFVGRKAELEAIAAVMSSATTGDGRFLVLGGEAGIGKTRLIDQAARHAQHAGALTATGRCIELTTSSAPFAPLGQLLRGLRSELVTRPLDGPDGDQRMSALDDLLSAPSPAETIGVGADSRQMRFFEAWLDLLDGLGAARPLLIVIEDIHWADRSTIDWLTYVARGRARTHFTVIATLRTDELHRQHPIQPFLAELQRMSTVRRLDIQRFDRGELAEQVAAISGAPADPGLLDRIYARSNGNAFFSEELVAISDGDAFLPQGLRDVVLARVTELGGETQELLRVASTAGIRFSASTLARVAHLELELVESRLREAVDHQVVVPDPGSGALLFRHALTREAIYSELLPGERSRLHARFAAAISDEPDTRHSRSAEVAHHWLAAHDLPRAFDASVAAARDAAAVHGYADALQHYDRAIDLWDQVPDAADRAGVDRAGLLERAAATAATFDTGRALALITLAIETVGEDANPVRIALLRERHGRYAWREGDGMTALESCRDAARLMADAPPSSDRARVLASLAQMLMIAADFEGADPIAAEAVDIARSTAAPDIETHALTTLGVCTAYLGNLALGMSQLAAALDVAQLIGSVDDVARADANLVDVLNNSGSFRQAADVAIEASAFAEQHGLARVLGAMQLAEGAMALYRLGDWRSARDLLERALAPGLTGVPRIMAEERLAMIDVGEGRFDDARDRTASISPLLERVVEAQLITPLTEAMVELALWQNRPEQARVAVAEALDRLPVDRAIYISRIGPVFALGVRAEADMATLARVRGDVDGIDMAASLAARHANGMRDLRDSARAHQPNFISQADAWLDLCEAELDRLQDRPDPAVWKAAASGFAAIPIAYPRAYALWREAEARLSAGRRKGDATEPLREAWVLATALGAVPLLGEITALARRAHLLIGADVPTAAGTPAAADDRLGLTRRELEVLRLVAAGASNREIAEDLFITEGTAGTHVSNILGKLGVRGRTEAAAMAYRLRLVE